MADAVLEGRALTPAAPPTEVPLTLGFGWDRPANEEAWRTRLAKRQRLTRWRPRSSQFKVACWGICGVPILMGAHALAMAIASPRVLQQMLEEPWTPWLMASLFGIPLTALVASILGTEVIERFRAWKPVSALEEADLTKDMKDYLAHTGCRSYLRNVLASGVPRLLGNDVACLENLRQEGEWAAREVQWQEERLRAQAAERQREQQRIAQRPVVLAQIAEALKHVDDAKG